MRKILAVGLILAPILYYVALIGGAAAYPGYDHATRYASELSAEGAPYPQLFNYSIIAMGVASVLGAVGLMLCLQNLSGRALWPALAGVAFALWGARASLHPARIAGRTEKRRLKAFVGFIFVGSIVMLAIMMGVGELVRVENVGAWQRTYTAFAIPWTLAFGLWLILRKPT